MKVRKPRFIPTTWNLKKIAQFLQVSLVIASTSQFSPRVYTYWERYCKSTWDGRYTLQVLAGSNTSTIIRYCGVELYVTIDSITEDGGLRVRPSVEIA